MKLRYVCPRCNHGVELNVLAPPKYAPECACRPGRVTTTMRAVEVDNDRAEGGTSRVVRASERALSASRKAR